jgi:hypothetical protein
MGQRQLLELAPRPIEIALLEENPKDLQFQAKRISISRTCQHPHRELPAWVSTGWERRRLDGFGVQPGDGGLLQTLPAVDQPAVDPNGLLVGSRALEELGDPLDEHRITRELQAQIAVESHRLAAAARLQMQLGELDTFGTHPPQNGSTSPVGSGALSKSRTRVGQPGRVPANRILEDVLFGQDLARLRDTALMPQ